jgi:hypothetical protein
VGKEQDNLEASIKKNSASVRGFRLISSGMRENALAANKTSRQSLADSKAHREIHKKESF